MVVLWWCLWCHDTVVVLWWCSHGAVVVLSWCCGCGGAVMVLWWCCWWCCDACGAVVQCHFPYIVNRYQDLSPRHSSHPLPTVRNMPKIQSKVIFGVRQQKFNCPPSCKVYHGEPITKPEHVLARYGPGKAHGGQPAPESSEEMQYWMVTKTHHLLGLEKDGWVHRSLVEQAFANWRQAFVLSLLHSAQFLAPCLLSSASLLTNNSAMYCRDWSSESEPSRPGPNQPSQ